MDRQRLAVEAELHQLRSTPRGTTVHINGDASDVLTRHYESEDLRRQLGNLQRTLTAQQEKAAAEVQSLQLALDAEASACALAEGTAAEYLAALRALRRECTCGAAVAKFAAEGFEVEE